MESQRNKGVAKPDQNSVPKDILSRPIQYDPLYQRRSLIDYPLTVGVDKTEKSVLALRKKTQRKSAEKNTNSMNALNESLQPSIPNTNLERQTRSKASESMGKMVVGCDVNNAGGSSKFSSKVHDFPSTKQQQSNMLVGNGRGAQNATSIEICNDVHENRNIALDHSEANLTELNQNLSTNPNASSTNPQPANEENNETEQREMQAKRKPSKKYRKMRKLQDILSSEQQQSSMMLGNREGAQNVIIGNCNVVHENRNIAPDHFESNPNELNQNLRTDTSASDTNHQLEKEGSDETEEQGETKAYRRPKMNIEKECQEMIDYLQSLNAETAELKRQLLDLAEKCVQLRKENNSLLKELFE